MKVAGEFTRFRSKCHEVAIEKSARGSIGGINEDCVSARASEGVMFALDHRVELLATASSHGEHTFRDLEYRTLENTETTSPITGWEGTTLTKMWATPLDLIARLLQRFDSGVTRNHARNFLT
jgi:hypothetical protein